MGITGLWPILEPSCTPVTLESLEGKKLAVDVSIWIYQAQLGYSAETKSPHLALLINRICKMIFYKIRPVFVFDGPDVPVMKRRVLEARRFQKITEDITISKQKKRHLEELVHGEQSEANIEKVKQALTSPSKKFREELEMFKPADIPEIQVVNVSDDDEAEIIVDKEVKKSESGIDDLIDIREHMRESRLHPSMIPKETEDFCKFQLNRVLQRSFLDKKIKEMAKQRLDSTEGGDVRVSVADRSGVRHTVKYDDDVQFIDEPATGASSIDVSTTFTAGHDIIELPSTSGIIETDEVYDEYENYLSKTKMIEDLMKRRIGHYHSPIKKSNTDNFTSSDDDDDLIDVPDVPLNLSPKKKTVNTQEQEENDVIPLNDVPSTSQSTYESDSGVYKELQSFLTSCGFPYLEAPGEAEAQCVVLESLGLVEGVVSDDSDVLAFGVKNVYRHLFSSNKNIQHYNTKKIEKETGLRQEHFVSIAMISGGDYSVGLRGVGVIAAIELVAEMTDNSFNRGVDEISNILKKIDFWYRKENPANVDTPILRKLREIIDRQNESSQVVLYNKDVIEAYLNPLTDRSKEVFRWKAVNIPQIQAIVLDKLGWEETKFEKVFLQPLERWNAFINREATYQKHITSFVTLQQSANEQKTQLSKRTLAALEKIKTKNEVQSEPQLVLDNNRPVADTIGPSKSRKRRGGLSRKTCRGAKPAIRKAAKTDQSLCLSESSDSD